MTPRTPSVIRTSAMKGLRAVRDCGVICATDRDVEHLEDAYRMGLVRRDLLKLCGAWRYRYTLPFKVSPTTRRAGEPVVFLGVGR